MFKIGAKKMKSQYGADTISTLLMPQLPHQPSNRLCSNAVGFLLKLVSSLLSESVSKCGASV